MSASQKKHLSLLYCRSAINHKKKNMLIGQKFIFIHYPRTGGTSVRNHLSRLFPDNYLPMSDPRLSREQQVNLTHQSLVVCHQYAKQSGVNPLSLPTLVCIRNPYSLMLSEYMYLKQKWGKKIKDLDKTFSGYLNTLSKKVTAEKKQRWKESHYGRYQDYLCINGSLPVNLTIARYESLEEDVNRFIAEKLGLTDSKAKLPHKNASRHGKVAAYYTEKDEQLVYDMWQNVFDNGLYNRFDGLDVAS